MKPCGRTDRQASSSQKKEDAFNQEHRIIEASYAETNEDREKYPSDVKRIAVIKSRLAHNLGYKILAAFPDPSTDSGSVYSYRILVKEEK